MSLGRKLETRFKALDGFVRFRSGLEMDGMPLMARAFSPNNLILKFNDLSDQSDRDEQKGFVIVRAHRFVPYDPERALDLSPS
jgi:uncharacterized protein Ymh